MTFSRRSLLAALAGIPLIGKVVKAAEKSPTRYLPNDVRVVRSHLQNPSTGGFWLHIEETPNSVSLLKQDYFSSLSSFVRDLSGAKWLSHYLPKEVEFEKRFVKKDMMEARRAAMAGDSLATMIHRIPQRANVPIGLKAFVYFIPDVITYKPVNGPVVFIACKWKDCLNLPNEYMKYQITHMWKSKYSGKYGESIAVHAALPSDFAQWEYNGHFNMLPDSNHVHMIVVDTNGLWTRVPGTVLERFSNVNLMNVNMHDSRYITYL